MFQSYQSKQINPDLWIATLLEKDFPRFQSYQSKQINPDFEKFGLKKLISTWVSIVSIQTDQSRQLPSRNQSWRGSQMPNGGTYF